MQKHSRRSSQADDNCDNDGNWVFITEAKSYGHICQIMIQGFFLTDPPKKLKYVKPRLGVSTLT